MPRFTFCRLAHYKVAAVVSVMCFGVVVGAIGIAGWHAEAGCVSAAAVLVGLASWYAAAMTDKAKADDVMRAMLKGVATDLMSEPPPVVHHAMGSVYYSQLRSFGDYSNERVGITLPVPLMFADGDLIAGTLDAGQVNARAAESVLAAARKWVDAKLNERIAGREQAQAAARESHNLRIEIDGRRAELNEINERLVRAKEFAEKLGVKVAQGDGIPF